MRNAVELVSPSEVNIGFAGQTESVVGGLALVPCLEEAAVSEVTLGNGGNTEIDAYGRFNP